MGMLTLYSHQQKIQFKAITHIPDIKIPIVLLYSVYKIQKLFFFLRYTIDILIFFFNLYNFDQQKKKKSLISANNGNKIIL